MSNDVLHAIRRLAWTDILNSAAWIWVVIVLEVEVRLQLRGKLSNTIMDTTKYLKLLLYTTLFAAAGYWGYAGDFIDVWDASLWLFAFIFIELNVFEWQYETTIQRSLRRLQESIARTGCFCLFAPHTGSQARKKLSVSTSI